MRRRCGKGRYWDICGGGCDLSAKRWTIPGSRTKNKSPQVVPLAPLALKIVEEGFAHTGTDQAFAGRKMLIASTGHALTRGFIRLREDVGVGDLTVHDLRRTGATMMAEIGISGDVISRILNRFDYEPQKREALERWEAHLMQISWSRCRVLSPISVNGRNGSIRCGVRGAP